MKWSTIIHKVPWFFGMMFCSLIACAEDTAAKKEAVTRYLLSGQLDGNQNVVSAETESLLSLGTGISKLAKTLAITIGAALIIFSIQKYGNCRRDPIETPLYSVIMMFFIGLALIGIAFIPMQF